VAIDIEQLAMQIYIETVSPGIMERVLQGSSLDKLFKGAAAQSIIAAEEFARACNERPARAHAVPSAKVPRITDDAATLA
jgi:hypothetical protein